MEQFEWQIIIDKPTKMFHYYSFFPNFVPSFYEIQNPTSIATLDYSYHHLNKQIFQNVKHEQQPLKNSNDMIFPDPIFFENLKLNNEFKNPATQQLEELSQIQEIQSSIEKNNSLEDKLRKIKQIQKTKNKDGKKKVRGEKKDRAYIAKQYPKQEPSINCRYIQKNFELNIINQVFSFLWSEQKSQKFVKRFFKDEIKTTLYFEYIKIVRKFSKRYINKEYLKNLCNYQNHHIAYKMVSKNSQKLQYLSITQFSQCTRHLIFIYLHQLCPQAVLTSKKMRREIWSEHLIKCRLLRNFMFYDLSAEDYEKALINNKSDEAKMTESISEKQQS